MSGALSWSLRVRFVVVMLLGCAVFSLTVLLVVESEAQSTLRGRTMDSTRAQLLAHADTVAERVLVEDEVGLRALLVRIVETNPDWDALELTRGRHAPVRVARSDGVVQIGDGGHGPGAYEVRVPMLAGSDDTLTVWVFPSADEDARSHQVTRLVGLLVALSLGGIGAAALFGHWLTAPLVAMAEQVRALGAGTKLDIDVPEGEGEVSVLAEAMRSTLQTLARAQADLEANQRHLVEVEKLAAVGTLAAGVAHEVANPISGAIACVRRLGRDDLPAQRRQEYTDLATEALDRALRVLRELLDYARPGLEGPAELDVDELVSQTVRLAASSSRKHIQVQPGGGAVVRWPRRQVEQVLLNLVLNAVAAAREQVRLTWRAGDDAVSIEIIDDGPGIPAEIRGRVFEPFFTTRPVGQGTGLGLSVSLSLVHTMGGRLDLDDATPAPGTVARLVLPRAIGTEKSG